MTNKYDYPYTNLNDVNLDWVVETVGEVKEKSTKVLEQAGEALEKAEEAAEKAEGYSQRIKNVERIVDSVQSDVSGLLAEVPEKMQRYIIRLVAVGSGWQMQKYESGEVLTFPVLLAAIRDTSNYVVVVYGNSKLRPQYVSTNEMMFIGLDRASSSSKILRIIFTPSRLTYETFEIAEKSFVAEEYQEKLESGQNIKTVNGYSLLGQGNIVISGGGGGGGGAVDDVVMEGASIVANGIATIPRASNDGFGVVKMYPNRGIEITSAGNLSLKVATEAAITARRTPGVASSWGAITPDRVDFSVKTALCDGVGPAYTASEQAAARARLGILSAEGVEF